jgi:hypothetical protein
MDSAGSISDRLAVVVAPTMGLTVSAVPASKVNVLRCEPGVNHRSATDAAAEELALTKSTRRAVPGFDVKPNTSLDPQSTVLMWLPLLASIDANASP